MPESSAHLVEIIKGIPYEPGIYQYYNKAGKILYIGKAKSLRKRVSSYFTSSKQHTYRIRKLVEQIADIKYTITHSEVEALVLENNLIKNHQPKYNILLKDGKTYPYICIKNERFPRIFSTRNKYSDGSQYFGPYPSVATMNDLLALIRGFVKLRTCNYHLSQANIEAGKFRRCLEFQIGNCAGPCEGLMDEDTYNEGIQQVKNILKGKMKPVLDHLEQQMNIAAEAYEFEKAEFLKRRIDKVKAFKRKNAVVSEKIENLEVITAMAEKHLAVINHFRIFKGAIIQTHSWEVKRNNEEDEKELVEAGLQYLLARDEDLSKDIITHIELTEIPEGFEVNVPKRGDKKHLIELSLKNCKSLLTEKLYNQNFRQRKTPSMAMMEALQQALNLSELPDHIECFDNSNFHGTAPVASVVVFKGGKPAKRDYRHFNIKTVQGSNDFASMKEIVHRRYKRQLEEKNELPKLIIVDGGKGQLSSSAESLRSLGLLGKVPLIGIAKRLEEIYIVDDPIPLHIDKKSPALHLIQQIRNEAHRFAITFHRKKRSQAPNQKSALSTLDGIGPATEKKLLRTFKSVSKIKQASEAELIEAIGKKKAIALRQAIDAGKI